MTVDTQEAIDRMRSGGMSGEQFWGLMQSPDWPVGKVDAVADLDASRSDIASLAGSIEHLQKMLKAKVVEACDEGLTEVEAAKLAQVSRMTIRSWRGK